MWNTFTAIGTSLLHGVSPFTARSRRLTTDAEPVDGAAGMVSFGLSLTAGVPTDLQNDDTEIIDLYNASESQHDDTLHRAVDATSAPHHDLQPSTPRGTMPASTPPATASTTQHSTVEEMHLTTTSSQYHTAPVCADYIPIDSINQSFPSIGATIHGCVVRQYGSVSEACGEQYDENTQANTVELRYEILDRAHPSYGIHTIELHCRNLYTALPPLLHVQDYITVSGCSVQSAVQCNDMLEHKYILVLDAQLADCTSTVLSVQTQRQRLLNRPPTVYTAQDITQRSETQSAQHTNNTHVQSLCNDTVVAGSRVRGVKRKQCGSSAVSYTPLAELRVNTQDNVYGIITRYSDGKRSQGTDWHLSLNITDHTWHSSPYYTSESDGLTINLFRADALQLPRVQRRYDIIRLHRIDIKLYQSHKLQGISHKHRSSHVLIDGRLNAPYEPYHTSSEQSTEVDREVVDALRTYIHTQYIQKKISNTSDVPAALIDVQNSYARLLSELQRAEFCDLYVKLVYVDAERRLLYVWDGTVAPLPLKYNTLSNGESTPDGVRMLPEYGTIVPVSCSTVSSKEIQAAVPGQWCHLKNINVQISDTGALYINFFKYSKCASLADSSSIVQGRLQQYKQRSEHAHTAATKHNKHSTATTDAAPLHSESLLRNLKYVSSLHGAETVDLIIKVFGTDPARRLLYIWDSTDVQCRLQYNTMENNKGTPAYGTILSVTHSDSVAYMLANAQLHHWVLLTNIKVVSNDQHKVFLRFDRHSTCTALDAESPHVLERINNYQQRCTAARTDAVHTTHHNHVQEVGAQQNEPIDGVNRSGTAANTAVSPAEQSVAAAFFTAPCTESLTVHPYMCQQIVPIKSVISAKSDSTARKHRLHVRVYGISPLPAHSLVVLYCRSCHCTSACAPDGNDACSQCTYDTDIEYQYAFKVLLGDVTGVIPVLVCGDGGRTLLQIEPCNLYTNHNIRYTIQRRVERLCSVDGWLDCCIVSYTACDEVLEAELLSQVDDDEAMHAINNIGMQRKNYQIYDTMLKLFE